MSVRTEAVGENGATFSEGAGDTARLAAAAEDTAHQTPAAAAGAALPAPPGGQGQVNHDRHVTGFIFQT